MSKIKRICFRRSQTNTVEVKGEPHYNMDMNNYQNLFLKNKRPENIPVEIVSGVPVSQEKKQDVSQLLLKHFRENWRSNEQLLFYKRIIDGTAHTENDDDDCDEPECMYCEELPELMV